MKPNYDVLFLYIDLFCGAGGTATGIERARSKLKKIARVIACVNHDKNAIASHKCNHPHAVHYTEDMRTLDLTDLVAHVKSMRLLYPNAKVIIWASLECTHHSRAKGGQSRDADSRSLAEHLYRYEEAIQPDGIQIENVTEFLTWGPLKIKEFISEDGYPCCPINWKKDKATKRLRAEPIWIPDPGQKGIYFNRWKDHIKGYGYKYDHRIINAANLGARTSRERYFGMFARNGLPLVFPKQTHAKDPAKYPGMNYKKWLPVGPLLDRHDLGQSVYRRKKTIAENSFKRIYEGAIVHIAGGKEAYYNRYVEVFDSVDRIPISTATGSNGHYLVKAFSGNPQHKSVSLDSPAGAITTVDHHQFISATGHTEFLAAYYGNGFTRNLDEPAPAVTCKDRLSYIHNNTIIEHQFGNSKCSSVDEVIGCITTNPKYRVVHCQQWILNPQWKSKGVSLDKPCFTLIARMDKAPAYLVSPETATDNLAPFIKIVNNALVYEIYDTDSQIVKDLKELMWLYGIVDIKMRMLNETELLRIMELGDDYELKGTATERKKYIGNAVHPLVPKLWCERIAKAMKVQQSLAA